MHAPGLTRSHVTRSSIEARSRASSRTTLFFSITIKNFIDRRFFIDAATKRETKTPLLSGKKRSHAFPCKLSVSLSVSVAAEGEDLPRAAFWVPFLFPVIPLRLFTPRSVRFAFQNHKDNRIARLDFYSKDILPDNHSSICIIIE